MNDAIEALISRVIEREGGYVNHPADRGGPTNYGITLAALHDWRGASVGAGDVAAMTEQEARAIYRDRYFVRPGLDCVTDPATLDLLFDFAVNSGPGAAVKALQLCLGVPADGAFGPQSRAALAAVTNWPALFYRLKAERLELFLRYIGRDPAQAVFAAGWANRLDHFEREGR
jgi:lysozyme family protein